MEDVQKLSTLLAAVGSGCPVFRHELSPAGGVQEIRHG